MGAAKGGGKGERVAIINVDTSEFLVGIHPICSEKGQMWQEMGSGLPHLPQKAAVLTPKKVRF